MSCHHSELQSNHLFNLNSFLPLNLTGRGLNKSTFFRLVKITEKNICREQNLLHGKILEFTWGLGPYPEKPLKISRLALNIYFFKRRVNSFPLPPSELRLKD